MGKTKDKKINNEINFEDSSLYINRELSWLSFNERVLSEAEDEKNPLFERIKFLAITASKSAAADVTRLLRKTFKSSPVM